METKAVQLTTPVMLETTIDSMQNIEAGFDVISYYILCSF
jgi:hypothetical protein